MPERLISIGELARRSGVAVTALRYYDELGLVRPNTRASGQRRYAESAVRAVGVVLLLRDVGFSLAEVAELIAARTRTPRWSALVSCQLAALAEHEHRLLVARTLLEHARDCPAEHPSRCPRFWSIIDARLRGESLEDSHAAMHQDGQSVARPSPHPAPASAPQDTSHEHRTVRPNSEGRS